MEQRRVTEAGGPYSGNTLLLEVRLIAQAEYQKHLSSFVKILKLCNSLQFVFLKTFPGRLMHSLGWEIAVGARLPTRLVL